MKGSFSYTSVCKREMFAEGGSARSYDTLGKLTKKVARHWTDSIPKQANLRVFMATYNLGKLLLSTENSSSVIARVSQMFVWREALASKY